MVLNLECSQRKEEGGSDSRWDAVEKKGVWARVEKLVTGDSDA